MAEERKTWRPKGWECVQDKLVKQGCDTICLSHFEVGADAMLLEAPEAMKSVGIPQRMIDDFRLFTGAIPDEEGNDDSPTTDPQPEV